MAIGDYTLVGARLEHCGEEASRLFLGEPVRLLQQPGAAQMLRRHGNKRRMPLAQMCSPKGSIVHRSDTLKVGRRLYDQTTYLLAGFKGVKRGLKRVGLAPLYRLEDGFARRAGELGKQAPVPGHAVLHEILARSLHACTLT